MNETEFKNKILLPGLRPFGHMELIENVAGTGTPDINYAFTARNQGWMETKVLKSGWVYFEKFQLPWINRRIKHTAFKHVWVVVFSGEGICFIKGRVIVQAPREPHRKWVRVELIKVPGFDFFYPPYPWQKIVDLLAETE